MTATSKELCELRGEVISKFSEVEGHICNLITAHFFGDINDRNQEFRESLLFSQFIPSIARIELFENIFSTKTNFAPLKTGAGDDRFAKLRQLSNLRNFFAHARVVKDGDGEFKLYTIDGGERVTSDDKLKRFDELFKEIVPILQVAVGEIPYFKNFKK